MASNITAGRQKEIDALLNHGLHTHLIKLLMHEQIDVKKEACVALGNIFVQGTEDHVQDVIGNDFLEALAKLITPEQDGRLLAYALESVTLLLRRGKELGKDIYALFVQKTGCLDAIEGLVHHPSRQIFGMMEELVDEFFGRAEEEENQLDGKTGEIKF